MKLIKKTNLRIKNFGFFAFLKRHIIKLLFYILVVANNNYNPTFTLVFKIKASNRSIRAFAGFFCNFILLC